MARLTRIADLVPAAIDAAELAQLVSERLVAIHRESITSGVRADGTGRQSPGGGADGIRGYRTGRLASGIKARVVKSDEGKASVVIEPPADRIDFLRSEAEQGIYYLMVGDEGTPQTNDLITTIGEYIVRLLKDPHRSNR